jgi:hypothetical protein
MTWDTRNGRSVETILAELRAIESRTINGTDPALLGVVDHLRRAHEEARRARRREHEDDLLAVPGIVVVPGGTPATDVPIETT